MAVATGAQRVAKRGDDVVLVAKPVAPAPAAVPPPVMALDPNSQLRQDYMLAAQINTEAGWDARKMRRERQIEPGGGETCGGSEGSEGSEGGDGAARIR